MIRFIRRCDDPYSRGIEPEKLKELADGRIFSADRALEHNLIDGIGYWEDAVAKTAELLGEESVRVIRYEWQEDFFTWLSRVRLNLNPTAWLRSPSARLVHGSRRSRQRKDRFWD